MFDVLYVYACVCVRVYRVLRVPPHTVLICAGHVRRPAGQEYWSWFPSSTRLHARECRNARSSFSRRRRSLLANKFTAAALWVGWFGGDSGQVGYPGDPRINGTRRLCNVYVNNRYFFSDLLLTVKIRFGRSAICVGIRNGILFQILCDSVRVKIFGDSHMYT